MTGRGTGSQRGTGAASARLPSEEFCAPPRNRMPDWLQQGDCPLLHRDRLLCLLPEKAIFDDSTGTLFIADPHWGKAATFRAMNLPVPSAHLGSDLDRLSTALHRTRANRLVVLGDLLHHRLGIDRHLRQEIRAWCREHEQFQRVLIRGNHDSHAGDPPEEWGFACHDEPFADAGLTLRHHPVSSAPERSASRTEKSSLSLAGHLHPAVRLRGQGRQQIKLPCFLLQQSQIILPAFSSFADGGILRPGPHETVAVIAESDVILIPQPA